MQDYVTPATKAYILLPVAGKLENWNFSTVSFKPLTVMNDDNKPPACIKCSVENCIFIWNGLNSSGNNRQPNIKKLGHSN